MKYILALLLFILFILSLTANCQTNPFDTLNFDKVVMYDFNDKGLEIKIIDKNGQLDKSVTKQVVLGKKTVDELNNKLGTKPSYVKGSGLCFFPHLGFVYYKKESVVASISVCLMCHNLESSVVIPAQVMDQIEAKGETLYLIGGMSDQMMDYMNSLVKSHKFSHATN